MPMSADWYDGPTLLQLLESRLGDVNLENPIRDFEVHVMPIPEKSRPGGKPAVLLLKVDGTKVTGSFTNNAGELPLTGVVDGDNVSFTLNADKDGRSTKFNYSGKVSGDTIKFTVNREGGTAPPRTMTFKREPN